MAQATEPSAVEQQSAILPGEERIRVSKLSPEGKLIERAFDNVGTVYELFLRGLDESKDGPCLGERTGEKGQGPYEFLKYSQVLKRAKNFGSGLTKLGIPAGQEGHVGISSQNCINWILASLSSDAFSRVTVPLYDTLGMEAVKHIIGQADVSVIVCHPKTIKTILQCLPDCSDVKHVITWAGGITEENKKQVEGQGAGFHSFEDIEKLGEENPTEPQTPKPEDICTICYTSGTTGLPKGAIVTHGNIVAMCGGMHLHIQEHIHLSPADVHISFLPLAHMMERAVEAHFLSYGMSIGFFRGDPKLLVEDVQALKPTVFVAVPRLFNKVYDKVMVSVSGSMLKRFLMNQAIYWKGRNVDKGVYQRGSLWDKVVFGKIQELLGGRVRIIVSGSAPLAQDIMRFYRIALGCPFLEGYGQTETTAAATFTVFEETHAGVVGPPLPCVMIKLVDVPELGYFGAKDEGEICFKGASIFKGYWKNKEKTDDTIDKDGWAHSGDIGKWLPSGTLKIIDRKKQIFKTSLGEYIAPEKLENVYRRSLFIEQICVHGDSLKSNVVAIIVPDEEYLTQWASQRNLAEDFKTLCQNKDLIKMILEDMTRFGVEEGLKSFEQVKAIHLSSELFSVENECLTPTQKLVRHKIVKKFREEIDQMYASLP